MECHNEKTSYYNLYNLYQSIINEIKDVKLCDICLSRQNIDIHNLNMNEIENLVRNSMRALKEGKLPLDRKKEMVNKLLQ